MTRPIGWLAGLFHKPEVTRTERLPMRGMFRDHRKCSHCGRPMRHRDYAR